MLNFRAATREWSRAKSLLAWSLNELKSILGEPAGTAVLRLEAELWEYRTEVELLLRFDARNDNSSAHGHTTVRFSPFVPEFPINAATTTRASLPTKVVDWIWIRSGACGRSI
ncbi:hypothetical protein FOZ63_000958 [Perkinsus olseni]|uniref:Uncharacterized protein n=1 Tax=Perkinsus olseni TaxID=32597 RepID=A0A7J6ULD0_PEROL|nr:hypothetical protein FOZ63_000958 [Perkinsus olseni]